MDDSNERRGPGLWAMLGQVVATVPLGLVIAAEAATGGVPLVAAAAGFGLFKFGQALVSWALPDGATGGDPLPIDRIRRERQAEGFEPKAMHVGICGPSGSGKSSIVNALRGLRNGASGAARTGTVETTLNRGSYAAHDSLGALFIHDVPGAGTLRIPAEDYYHHQKLYLYDSILIVQGERFGQIEISIIRECIRQHQSFVIVRSRSDELVRRIADDGDYDIPRARAEHLVSTLAGIRDELERSRAPEGVLEDLARLLVLVNKFDLQRLAALGSDEWPAPGDREMQERTLLKFLGKTGVDA